MLVLKALTKTTTNGQILMLEVGDGKGARPPNFAEGSTNRRRGDRIDTLSCCNCSQPVMALNGPAKLARSFPLSEPDRKLFERSEHFR
jgi:hypothetical protein